jgi:hypothetical protein
MTQNMQQKGSAMLHRNRRQKVSVPVVYCRGETELELQATVGWCRTNRDDNGAITTSRARDYVFQASELVLTSPAVPIAGDLITEEIGGVERQFQVCQTPDDGCFRKEGLADEAIRVHTVEVGVAP